MHQAPRQIIQILYKLVVGSHTCFSFYKYKVYMHIGAIFFKYHDHTLSIRVPLTFMKFSQQRNYNSRVYPYNFRVYP